MNVLLVGRGSIGKKHLQTLEGLRRALHLSLFVFEPSNYGAQYYKELSREIRNKKIDTAFVCNPTSMHAKSALVCLRAGANVFLEKPLSDNWDEKTFLQIRALLKTKKLTLMVGYDMRFNPWIRKVKGLVDARIIGNIWGARVMAGQYLPDWRLGKDYRSTYSAKRALGGGVLLDLSHELDYLHWLLPKEVVSVTARNINTGRLKIDTEDVSSMVLQYDGSGIANIHLDYLTVPYRRSLELYGDKGMILWDDNSRELRVYTKRTGKWKKIKIRARDAEGAAIFKNELIHFFDCIKHKRVPLNSLENSMYVMKLIQKAKQSSEKNRTMKI